MGFQYKLCVTYSINTNVAIRRNQYAPIFARLVSRHSKENSYSFQCVAPRRLWPQSHCSPKHTSAIDTIRPKEYFGSNNTSARCLLQPEILHAGNTSARKYFNLEILQPETTSAQYTLAPGPNFQKCHF